MATEVKELAAATGTATEDISKRVEAIQSNTAQAVAAIAQIAQIIGKIDNYQTTIAAAVEEQSATTNEMARNVAEASTGSSEIAASLTKILEEARQNSELIAEASHVFGDFKESATTLHANMSQYKI